MSEWVKANLGSFCRFRAGSAFPQVEQGAVDGAVPFVKVSDFSLPSNQKYIKSSNNWLNEEQVARMRPARAQAGTSLFAKIGEGLKSERVRLVTQETAFDNNLMSATPLPGTVEPEFLYYLLRHIGISKYAEGTALPYLKQSVLDAIECTVPSTSEQRSIANVLRALDDKGIANTELAKTASTLASVLFNQSLLGAVLRPMSEVLTPILGGTPARANPAFWGGSNFWVSAKDITGAQNGVLVSTAEHISDAAITQTKAKPLPAGSVVITARGTVGAVARLAVASSFNQSCYGFLPDSIPSSILYFGVLNAVRRAKAIAHGSVFDTITMKTFDHLDFPTFSTTETETLERNLKPLLDVVETKVVENRGLAELRDTLLPELMSGRLRVKDAEKKIEEVV